MQFTQDVIHQLALELETADSFLGGPEHLFNEAGDTTLDLILSKDIKNNARTLDIGCGCLRIGIKLINYLQPDCYYGIEPNKTMLNIGIKHLLFDGLRQHKSPRFSNNSNFSIEEFNIDIFDCFIARSIWTHASKKQIILMLDLFQKSGSDNAVFFTSILKKNPKDEDYMGGEWVGRSHNSNRVKCIHHSMDWIIKQCDARSMNVTTVEEPNLNFGNQIWLEIKKKT